MKRHHAPLVITVLVLAFFYLPLAVVAANSFNRSGSAAAVWKGFTVDHYAELFRHQGLRTAIKNTVFVGLVATAAATVLGTFAAVALYRYRTRLQFAHRGLIYTPLVIPDLLMGISLLLFFMALNMTLGLGTIVIAHTTFCVSYVAMTVLARLQDFDWTLIDAARDLGASRVEAVRRVLLPLLAPGILAGALLAFTLSVDDYVVTFFVKGEGSSKTLPIEIEGIIQRGRHVGVVNALSVAMLALTFGLTWASQRLAKTR